MARALAAALLATALAALARHAAASDLRVRILHVTDVHGWMMGHPHNATLNCDYGDFASLVERLRAAAAQEGSELLVLDSGDLVEGTGLSDATPIHGEFIFPIAQQVDYDALTIGNHDIGHPDTVALLKSTYVPNWAGKYITSNTFWVASKDYFGVPYQVITTALGTRVLVLGYIYNFLQNANNTQIVFMNQSVLLPTFKQAMNEPAIDLIVVPCHIDPQSGVELSQLYQAIRAARPSTPLVLLSGHRHVTYFKQYDPNAFTLESGKYFEVVGDISFTLSGDPGDRQLNALSYRWVPTALSQFSAMANVSEDEFLTPHGAMVKEMIRNYSTSLDLDQVYGCSPLTYSPYTWDASNSFFQLYVERVVPSMVFDASLPHTQVFIANSFTLRWYLYQGPVNKNDIYTVLPFNDTFYGVFSVMGSDLQTLITKLRSKSAAHLAEEPAAPPSPMATIRSMPRQRHHYCGVHPFDAQLPAYVVSLDPNTIQPNAVYDVLAAEYDCFTIQNILQQMPVRMPFVVDVYPALGNRTTTFALRDYVATQFPKNC